ncbi:unnamed protein product [Arabis nemorensis]|uniref:Uncharacterized protein n=1 Tax=Arabis nemorensis TaxID=586526 RepID=A0A565CJ71_9BRAS|nr:unnamed protein product [Arabis nemorensis]
MEPSQLEISFASSTKWKPVLKTLSLEDGLHEVEVNVDEDASSRFCDRCTFQNSWGDKECKVCFIPFDCVPPTPPSSVDFGNNNT